MVENLFLIFNVTIEILFKPVEFSKSIDGSDLKKSLIYFSESFAIMLMVSRYILDLNDMISDDYMKIVPLLLVMILIPIPIILHSIIKIIYNRTVTMKVAFSIIFYWIGFLLLITHLILIILYYLPSTGGIVETPILLIVYFIWGISFFIVSLWIKDLYFINIITSIIILFTSTILPLLIYLSFPT